MNRKAVNDMFIEVKELEKYYGEKENRKCILNKISLNIKESSMSVILGPSGSGKSTLLNIIGGLESVDGGDVIVDGVSLKGASESKLDDYRRDKLGFIFQSYNLIPNLTVRENIEICEMLGNGQMNAEKIINDLGLAEHKNKFPRHLSGGQQQRTAIARALVKNPKLLLCDEPTGALDYETSKEALSVLEKVHELYKTTIVIVTHNEAISQMADQVIRLRDGKISKETFNEAPLSADKIDW